MKHNTIHLISGVPIIESPLMSVEDKPVIIPIGFDGLPLKQADLTINLTKVKCFLAHPDLVSALKNKLGETHGQ